MLLIQRLLPRLLQQGGLLLRLQLALPLRLRRLRGLLLLLPVHHLRLRHLVVAVVAALSVGEGAEERQEEGAASHWAVCRHAKTRGLTLCLCCLQTPKSGLALEMGGNRSV